jgi:ABC-type dipeptide/oligopeptide/nickel transport system permease component/ABC-type transport system substrate-binding protein
MTFPSKAKGVAVALALLTALIWLLSSLFQPASIAIPPQPPPQQKIAEAQALRDLTLEGEPPPLVVDVDYSAQSRAAWYPKNEAPILRDLVQAGKLAPLRDRIGVEIDGEWVAEPMVMSGVDGIGNYGGTWRRLDGINRLAYRLSATTLLRYDLYGRDVVPCVAKGYDVSDDNREFTFHLRRGIRWSDGELFTADDILYWWDWEANCKDIQSTPPKEMLTNNQPPKVVKVDDYTVKFIFPEAYGAFPHFLPRLLDVCNTPEHYLKRYHPTHPERDPEAVKLWKDELATTSDVTPYIEVKDASNPEHPRMWPWVYHSYSMLYPQAAVRNPYYWAVDPEGNQLPYVDRILFAPPTSKMAPGFGMATGGTSMQWGYNLFTDYTLYMRNRDKYDFQVYHWWSGEAPYVIYPNINLRADSGPDAAAKSELLADRRFRVALSLALDRQRIIDAVYRGVGEPRALVPEKGTRFYDPELAKIHHRHDPDEANRLLDELELDNHDSEGYRTLPDGGRLTLIQSLPGAGQVETAQFTINDWAAVGLRVLVRTQGGGLFGMERGARRQQLSWWSGQPNFPLLGEGVMPNDKTAPGFMRWFQSGGPYAKEGAEVKGIAPPPGHPVLENFKLYQQALAESDPAKQNKFMNQALHTYADQVWAINITKGLPQLIMVKNGFRNVPKKAVHAYQTYSPGGNVGIETFYWDEPKNIDDPKTVEMTRNEIVNITPRVGTKTDINGTDAVPAAGNPVTSGAWIAPLLKWLFIAIFILFIVMLAVRHPFVRKRLLLMLPMLLVISAGAFFIIQLPPGDYTTVRIAQLQEEGDAVQMQKILEIRASFNLDDPWLVQYLDWTGLQWFTTFDNEDKGLLQGVLGRSMKDNRSVNELVGDRLLLTFLITLGSVLLTWAIALPIGIYSAVRQYSIGDYIFTAMAFLGMCIPSFLLALILMVLTGVHGLFSPEFQTQAYWNWPKVADLLKHVWLPIVMVGVASTAGMIRVMRANLLDELKKPYVVTARAKGVRPVRLLLKYPVRIALNPFVSSIGGLFPALVSGSAIIAMVLGLPTVGPLLLNGIMEQDMYVAGSLLMVLSTLSIFGTLVSDLLLLALDPRIRYEK